jgi:hypothetical protein
MPQAATTITSPALKHGVLVNGVISFARMLLSAKPNYGYVKPSGFRAEIEKNNDYQDTGCEKPSGPRSQNK